MAVSGWLHANWWKYMLLAKRKLSLWPESDCCHHFNTFLLFSRNLLSHVLRQRRHCLQITRARKLAFPNHWRGWGDPVMFATLIIQEFFEVKMVCFDAVCVLMQCCCPSERTVVLPGCSVSHVHSTQHFFIFFLLNRRECFGLYEHENSWNVKLLPET